MSAQIRKPSASLFCDQEEPLTMSALVLFTFEIVQQWLWWQE